MFAYNAIVAGFVHNDMPKPALESYWGMRLVGVAHDKFTCPCVIKACSDLKKILETRKIHGLLLKFGLETGVGCVCWKCPGSFLFEIWVH